MGFSYSFTSTGGHRLCARASKDQRSCCWTDSCPRAASGPCLGRCGTRIALKIRNWLRRTIIQWLRPLGVMEHSYSPRIKVDSGDLEERYVFHLYFADRSHFSSTDCTRWITILIRANIGYWMTLRQRCVVLIHRADIQTIAIDVATGRKSGKKKEKNMVSGDDTTVKTGVWHVQVGIHKTSWHNGGGIRRGGWLASGMACGLARVEFLEGQWTGNFRPS